MALLNSKANKPPPSPRLRMTSHSPTFHNEAFNFAKFTDSPYFDDEARRTLIHATYANNMSIFAMYVISNNISTRVNDARRNFFEDLFLEISSRMKKSEIDAAKIQFGQNIICNSLNSWRTIDAETICARAAILNEIWRQKVDLNSFDIITYANKNGQNEHDGVAVNTYQISNKITQIPIYAMTSVFIFELIRDCGLCTIKWVESSVLPNAAFKTWLGVPSANIINIFRQYFSQISLYLYKRDLSYILNPLVKNEPFSNIMDFMRIFCLLTDCRDVYIEPHIEDKIRMRVMAVRAVANVYDGPINCVDARFNHEKNRCANVNCRHSAASAKYKCGRCKNVAYCSVACKDDDWPIHSYECT